MRVLQENETLVKMPTAELASVVEGLQGAARTPLGVLATPIQLKGEDLCAFVFVDLRLWLRQVLLTDGDSARDGEQLSAADGDETSGRGKGGGGGESRLLRQTTATVGRLESRLAALEGELSGGGGGGASFTSGFASRLEGLPYGSGSAAQLEGSQLRTRAQDLLSASIARPRAGRSAR